MKITNVSKTLLLSLLAGAVAGFCTAARADDSPLNHTDKSFLKDAYEGGLGEVQAAEMAERKTGNADVKAFAEMLATDHHKANSELKTLADSKKVSLSTEPSSSAQSKDKSLDAKTGGDFDKAFIDQQVTNHKKDIDDFQKEANEAKDTDVKNLVQQLLPTLKAHLSKAEGIQQKIGK
jgi:putative membrane protein